MTCGKSRYLGLVVLGGLLAILPALSSRAADQDSGVIKLFNGKDLTNFYTYLARPARARSLTGRTTIRKRCLPSTTA